MFRNSIIYGYPLAGITLEGGHANNAGLDKDTCRSAPDSTYIFNDVVETTGAIEYLNVSPRHSSAVIAANPSNIGLNSPFLTSGMLDYFDPLIEALAPSATPATLPVRFCGLSPVACSGVFSFDTVTWKGGALDASGAYWLSQDWAQFSGY
ncbi:hypothetical protein [Chitinophaga barathri]|uniref:Uncharacterized protein n=1 Tax=Chitinophaga barathri TaxID=1647451 RepID=A0A3N4M4U7_9BACT|nr:hypothetical protein [Chitinophaga barathri]RPD38174.1 hypothetical protein EG028_26300 [Chitinophaga barathri]